LIAPSTLLGPVTFQRRGNDPQGPRFSIPKKRHTVDFSGSPTPSGTANCKY